MKYSIGVCGFLLAAGLGSPSAHAQTVPGIPADDHCSGSSEPFGSHRSRGQVTSNIRERVPVMPAA